MTIAEFIEETRVESLGPGAADDGSVELWRWRYGTLRKAGYGRRDSIVLAGKGDVDLEGARRLRRLGCPADLAAEILL